MFLHSVLIGVLGKQLVDGVLRDLVEEKTNETKDMIDEAENIWRWRKGELNLCSRRLSPMCNHLNHRVQLNSICRSRYLFHQASRYMAVLSSAELPSSSTSHPVQLSLTLEFVLYLVYKSKELTSYRVNNPEERLRYLFQRGLARTILHRLRTPLRLTNELSHWPKNPWSLIIFTD